MAWSALPAVLLLWAALCVWAAHHLGQWFADTGLRSGWLPQFKLAIFLALLPLPLIDEILAKSQFDALCRHQGLELVAAQKLRSEATRRAQLPAERWPGLLVPVWSQKTLLIDVASGQTLAAFNTLQAQGGKLAHLLGSTPTPITFEGYCSPLRP